MFKNILVPTDGSDLAVKAVEQSVVFAKEIGANITAVTVTEPFHLISLAPSQLEYTPIEYKKYAEAHAEKVLGAVSAAAKSAGVRCETLHVEHAVCYSKEQAFHSLTDGRFKYIWRPLDGSEHFFDLDADPREEHDLSRIASPPEQVTTWRQRLIKLLASRPEGFSDGQKLIPGRPYPPLQPKVKE